jgi:hypothetical protein
MRDMFVPRARRGATQLGCLLTTLVIAGTAYFAIGAARTYWRSVAFKDALESEVRFRGKQPNHLIAQRLRFVADSLGLPPEAGNVTIRRKDGRITIASWYEETLVLPLHKRPWSFKPTVSAAY